MNELNEKLEIACEEHKITRHAYEALRETTSSDLRERFIEALGYCGRKVLSAYDHEGTRDIFSQVITNNHCQQIEQEWRNAYFDLLDLYHKVK